MQLLQEDLELEQVRVNSLTHMVVVVDESSGDSATAALESKLQASTPTHARMCAHISAPQRFSGRIDLTEKRFVSGVLQ